MVFDKDAFLTALDQMTVMELNELVKAIETKFGVSAETVAAPSNGPVTTGPVVEAQSEFNVILTDIGASKVNVIKAVREITSLGLKEAKELAESPSALIKEGIAKADAEAIKKKLEDAGAKVELK